MNELIEVEPREGLTYWGNQLIDESGPLSTPLTSGYLGLQVLPKSILIRADGGVLPHWVRPTFRAFERIAQLPAGWDSYGAPPINPIYIVAAVKLLTAVMNTQTPAPDVVPTNRGGVQLEWHVNDVDLEITINSHQQFLISYEHRVSGEAWERTVTSDLTLLVRAIDEISA